MTSYRICIIGDSHVAAFKNGWDEIAARYPHVEIVYFARQRQGLFQLVHEGTIITLNRRVARNFLQRMFGYTELDTSGIDLFVCVGMMEAVHAFAEMQAGHKLAAQSATGRQYVSDAAYVAAYADLFQASVMGHVVRTLSQAGVKKALVSLKPRHNEELLDRRTATAKCYRSLIAEGHGAHLARLLEDGLGRVLPPGFRYVAPPSEVLTNDLLTTREFSSGSVKLRSEHEHDDKETKHMNADYGARMLTAMFEEIGIEPRETPERDLPHDR